MTLQIRAATATDVAGIFHVRCAVIENALTLVELAALGITPETVTGMIASGPCAWVAVEGAEVIGFSMIDDEEGSLFAAFILPGHEGKGIGRQLVAVAEAQLFTRHAMCWLETGSTTRAAGFYRRLGWTSEQDVGNGDIRLEKRKA